MLASIISAAMVAAVGQTTPAAMPTVQPAVETAAVPATAPAVVTRTIPHDTPVELMATVEVSTADVVAGTRFKLRVNQPIDIDGRTVVPVGAWAYGEVLSADESDSLGKSGRMTARLLYLQLGDVQIPLEGDVSEKGRGAGSAVGAVLLGGWIGLFHRGNNAKIKAGEIVMGFISQDATFDLSGPVAKLVSLGTKAGASSGSNPPAPAAAAK